MKSFLLIIAIAISLSSYGQISSKERINTSTYYYTVSNVNSEQDLVEIQQIFSKMKFVSAAKYKYKGGSRAQLIVLVKEPQITSESQEIFSVKSLKTAIIKQGLVPENIDIQK